MQGVSVDDTGFCADPVSAAERFEAFSLVLQSPNASAFTLSPKTSGDLNNIFEAACSLDFCWSPSQSESALYNCSSSLGGAATSHSSSTPRSRPFVTMDLNLQNAADGENARGRMVPSFQDFVVSSDGTELGSTGDGAGFSGSNSGIMMGGFFCDLKNMSGGAPFQMDGSCGSPGVLVGSPSSDALSVFEKFLASTTEDSCSAEDLYSSDEFRMFEFKVRRCMRGRSHDWTECPFAHPGEKARRRDPRRFHYSGAACPDFRKGNCKRGDSCEFAHGVFECWLHPARYRTQPCKDGRNCRRRVCFFAHTPEQLRLLPAAAQAASAAIRSGESCQTQLSALKACAAQNGSCCGSFDGSSSTQSIFGDTFDGSNMSYDRFGCTSHGLFDGSCSRHGGCHGGSPRYKVAAQHSSFNCASYGGICCVSSQISSPTSTLVGLSQSPPTLSPPLSPTESPPASPEDWQGAFSHPLPIAATRGAFSYNLRSPSQTSVSQMQGLVSQTQSNNSMAIAAGTNIPHTSAHAIASVQRQHMDRLNCIPTLASPNLGQRRLLQTFASAPSSPHSAVPASSKAMSDLITSLQQLELKGANPLWLQTQASQAPPMSSLYSSGPSPLRRTSHSVPSTPSQDEKTGEFWETDVIEEDEMRMPRVESGRVLRAKIYGKLGKANRLDSVDSPDLGWVNELVEE